MIPPRIRSALMAIGALGALAAAGTPPTDNANTRPSAQASKADRQAPTQTPAPDRAVRADVLRALFGNSRDPRTRRFPGLGWSVAEDRRRAKKRRNQIRNRKAQKGRH